MELISAKRDRRQATGGAGMKLTIAELAQRIGAEVAGGSGKIDSYVTAVGPIEAAGESDITFLTDDRYLAALESSRAAAVITSRRLEGLTMPQLVVADVDAVLIEALKLFAPALKAPVAGVDPTAKVGQEVHIAEGVAIGPGVVIEDGAEIGLNSSIGSGCKLGQSSRIGKNCRLDSNVVVYHHCRLGDHVVVQANSTIGSVGFGYSFINGAHQLIPHNGGVVIEDFVEIGANCCIDRAKFGNTVIGAGTKIDNLVQIAHNVIVGKCCLIAGQVGIAGSCRLGDGVVLGGQVGLADNIEIGDGVQVAARSGVAQDAPAGQQLAGLPAIDIREALRIAGLIRRLPKFAEQLKEMTKRIRALEEGKDGPAGT
jgi:UDP-3-O-[3-hydroxymyristoyl] glucosamine N-acyltransferase